MLPNICHRFTLISTDDVFINVLYSVKAVKPLTSREEDRPLGDSDDWESINRQSLGIKYVRGCELKQVIDERKNVIGERDKDGKVNKAW
jgi:hypothetical protein